MHLTRLESCSTRGETRRDVFRFSPIVSSFRDPRLVPEVPSAGGKKWRSLELSPAIEQHLPCSHDCLAIAVPTCFKHATQFVCVSLFYCPPRPLLRSVQPSLSRSLALRAAPYRTGRRESCRELLQPSNDRVESS